ncbi:MAG: UDP-2,3-diacylglucosamine diphosphatase [Zoogloeaceae bacterium]|nr:UDP-2,3-diacylglucosamine diphosphatase [Zoogloeaceae bacterium]
MLYFISDLHLSNKTPGISALFRALLERIAEEGNALYILGDLFAVWIGDDENAPFAQEAKRLLREAANRGLKIFFQHGNRDFLVGDTFARAAQLTILPDPYRLEVPTASDVPQKSLLLTHGDILCTEDAKYQALRRKVRNPDWQQKMLRIPRFMRRMYAFALKTGSMREKGRKTDYQMDVSNHAVEEMIRGHGKRPLALLHGHIHRPGQYRHQVDDLPVERWVLADWAEDRGEYLTWDGATLTRHALPFSAAD